VILPILSPLFLPGDEVDFDSELKAQGEARSTLHLNRSTSQDSGTSSLVLLGVFIIICHIRTGLPLLLFTLSSPSSPPPLSSVFFYNIGGTGKVPQFVVAALTGILFLVGPQIINLVPRIIGLSFSLPQLAWPLLHYPR
jgi:hypothetical protein